MLQYRRDGWKVKELGSFYNVDHSSIVSRIKNNKLPERSRVWSVIDRTRLIMDARRERAQSQRGIYKAQRLYKFRIERLKKTVLKNKYDCIIHRTVNTGETYKVLLAEEKERNRTHIDYLVGL